MVKTDDKARDSLQSPKGIIVRFSYAALAASQRKQVEVRKQVGVLLLHQKLPGFRDRKTHKTVHNSTFCKENYILRLGNLCIGINPSFLKYPIYFMVLRCCLKLDLSII